MKQLEQTSFKRRIVSTDAITSIINRTRDNYKDSIDISVDAQPTITADTQIICDPVMLQYMLESLISSEYTTGSSETKPKVSVSISSDDRFCVFTLTDSRKNWNAEQISNLFYADSLTYNPETDQLLGSEYILCKQIIREHDDHCGVRGCKIYATAPNQLTFTLPLRM